MGNAHGIGLRVILCQLYLCLATYECRSADLICGDEWSFDFVSQARVRSNYRQVMSKVMRCNRYAAMVVDRSSYTRKSKTV